MAINSWRQNYAPVRRADSVVHETNEDSYMYLRHRIQSGYQPHA